MSQDKMNMGSDDWQKTMETPAVGRNSGPVGEIFDPWHLDKDGPPDSILEAIAKTLEKTKKMPESITVSLQPEKEEPPEEIPQGNPVEEIKEETPPSPVSETEEPKKDIDATQVVPEIEAKEEKEEPPADATMVVPVVKKEATPAPETKQPQIVREKAKAGRIWPPVLASSLFLIVACVITLVSAIMPVLTEHGFARGMTQIMAPVINAGEPPAYTNVLLVGVDEDGYRTDTMMVATYDIEQDKVYIMQLPRDTYVHDNGRRDKKLNSAYYSGLDQLKREVKMAYGIEIHKFVEVNLEGFRLMIDAIGGVEMDVPINMIYDDPVQDFHIYILKGKQVLNGDKAEEFVRFRQDNDGNGYPRGDLQRMEVQREFVMETIKQMVSRESLTNINELIKIAQENLKTDLSFDEIYNYCISVLTAEEGVIEFIDTPGEATNLPGGSYFVVDYDGAREVAQNYFYATQATMAKMKRIVVQPVQTSPPETETEADDDNSRQPSTATRRDEDDDSPRPSASGNSSALTRPEEDGTVTPGGNSSSGAMSR